MRRRSEHFGWTVARTVLAAVLILIFWAHYDALPVGSTNQDHYFVEEP
jgi:hypothetical protein